MNAECEKWAVVTGSGLLAQVKPESISGTESSAILKFMAANNMTKKDWDSAVDSGKYRCKKLS